MTPAEPSLATRSLTDIVGSTERASQLGDRQWGELKTRHHAAVRDELRRWGGQEVNESGDGFLTWEIANPYRLMTDLTISLWLGRLLLELERPADAVAYFRDWLTLAPTWGPPAARPDPLPFSISAKCTRP